MNDEIKKFIEPIRKALLADCDFTQVADAPLSPEVIAEYVTYRQAIRDMPTTQNPTTVEDVVWPVKPGSN